MSTKARALAKDAARMAAYSVWFCFVLWLSFWFSMPAGWVEVKLLPTKTPVGIELSIMLILWSGFICLLAWLPIWWARKRRSEIARSVGRNVIFLILLLVCTFLSTVLWQIYIPENLYDCSDDNFGGFLRPGDWVHNPVTVHNVVPSHTMSEPDTIKEGWSVPKLWCLWWSFVAASVVVSAVLAFLIWWLKTRTTSVTSAATCAGNAES